MKKTMVEIDVWSDYVCPFCYLAEPTLAQMQQEFRGELRISWHAFELRPDPVPTLDPKGDYLREVWQGSVYPMAQSRGMVLRLPPVQPRSRLAHEAAAFASDEGRFEEMNNALFRAFFEHGEDIGRPDILTRLATSAGIDGGKLATALKTKRYRQRVLADETKAHELGCPASRQLWSEQRENRSNAPFSWRGRSLSKYSGKRRLVFCTQRAEGKGIYG